MYNVNIIDKKKIFKVLAYLIFFLESGIRYFLLQIYGFGCGFLTQKKYGFADSGYGCGCGLPTLVHTID